MIKILKYFLFVIFLLDFNLQVQAKPVPPGSGEGDVPANILFLIDSSASMSRRLLNRDAIWGVPNAIYDSNGDILVSQERNLGVVKFNADGTRNTDYNNNRARFTGERAHACSGFSGLATTANYNPITRNTTTRATSKVRLAENLSTNDGTVTNENIVFFSADDGWWGRAGVIFGVSEDGQDCKFYIRAGFSDVLGMDLITIGGETYLFITGRCGWRNRDSCFTSFNVTRGERSIQRFSRNSNLGIRLRYSWRIAANSDASWLYVARWNSGISGIALTKVGNNYNLASSAAKSYTAILRGDYDTQLAPVAGIDVSPDDDNILYVTSLYYNIIQKIQLDTNTTYTVLARAGRPQRAANTEDPGTLAANSVRLYRPKGIHVTSTRILVTTGSGTIDEFDEDLFTAANVDTAWLQQMGGGAVSRWTGVKQAMAAIVSDTTLTSGAHFGYGHWNAGETGGPTRSWRGGRWCHFNNGCNYYRGWTGGTHPEGHSLQCNRDSCLNVGISAEGYTQILDNLMPQGLAWGTDANAYSIMALDYFTNDFPGYDEDSDCQINYVIVIGDGMMRNNNPAAVRIAQLRDLPNPVRTLFVAYGGGINAVGMARFDQMAVAGSCPGGDSSHPDCEPTIVADNPEELKTQLTSKIRQILAEKLSFTAPSITATVQEGGSLYQAQFAYEQYGEWQGTILRKTLKIDGTVDHDPNAPGNWDAGKKITNQATAVGTVDTRNIWSAIPTVDYIGNWDNFNIDNAPAIEELFGILGYTVQDYHNTTSNCSSATGVEDENADDILGLINFMKGSDYFDYDGDCNITERRGHVLGDIYHSQLVEIGPPDGSLDFTSSNEETYFRSVNNYQSFIAKHASRRKVIYAGSNSGMLHAINAETGTEEWAFIPPFIAGILPSIVNPELDGEVDTFKGGTNSIFGVDGSPVVHDVFIYGYDQDGNLEDQKNWHTILMIPYGRGGAGFSVLDVTEPILKDGKGPIHMFSIYNDAIANKVLVSDNNGTITEHTYSAGSQSVEESLEGQIASGNLETALETDGGVDSDVSTAQDAIAACQTNTDAGGSFHADGTASCYMGTTFTFEGLLPDAPDGTNVPKTNLRITERVSGTLEVIDFDRAQYVSGQLVVTFNDTKIFNRGGSASETRQTNNFNIATSCTSSSGIEPMYDYSQLGETWSAPRIFRIPSAELSDRGNSDKDTYVAVMGAGMGNTNLCAGSAVFIVNLDDPDNPGSIFGAENNGGPITIVDTSPSGVAGSSGAIATPNGSNIGNSLPSSPVVITPDTAYNIPWRGAMVYFNDMEGKITKINLTDSTKHDASLFDQTTLFRLNANTANKRYSYFAMDAGIGVSTNQFWLFGGTGNFNNIGGGAPGMDNILYGIKDPDYPHFKHLNDITVPSETEGQFVELAHQGANAARSIDDAEVCVNTTGKLVCADGPGREDLAWVIHLDTVDGLQPNDPATQNTFRKLSASPTIFKGYVYFPIYEPPPGTNKCNIGNAYICVADDECGTNNSHLLTKGGAANGSDCKFVREGILSELVIFGDNLYANVAGPKEDADTLYTVTAAAGEVKSSRGSWRESGF